MRPRLLHTQAGLWDAVHGLLVESTGTRCQCRTQSFDRTVEMSDQESAAATGVVKFSAGVVVNPEQRHSGEKEEAVTEVYI